MTIRLHFLINYSLRWQLFPIYQMFPCYYDSTEPRCILVAKSHQRRHNTKTQIVSKTLCLHYCRFFTQLHLLAQNITSVVPILNDKIPTKLLTQLIIINFLQTFMKLRVLKINSRSFFPKFSTAGTVGLSKHRLPLWFLCCDPRLLVFIFVINIQKQSRSSFPPGIWDFLLRHASCILLHSVSV